MKKSTSQEQSEKDLCKSYQKAYSGAAGLLVLTDQLGDLFVHGTTPEQQVRANKARELLEKLGLIEYNPEGKPLWDSLRKLVKRMTGPWIK